MATKPAALTV